MNKGIAILAALGWVATAEAAIWPVQGYPGKTYQERYDNCMRGQLGPNYHNLVPDYGNLNEENFCGNSIDGTRCSWPSANCVMSMKYTYSKTDADAMYQSNFNGCYTGNGRPRDACITQAYNIGCVFYQDPSDPQSYCRSTQTPWPIWNQYQAPIDRYNWCVTNECNRFGNTTSMYVTCVSKCKPYHCCDGLCGNTGIFAGYNVACSTVGNFRKDFPLLVAPNLYDPGYLLPLGV